MSAFRGKADIVFIAAQDFSYDFRPIQKQCADKRFAIMAQAL
jgi:hypothetical protein